uniref:Serine beta-lactamase-like protein LACTB, mitochondrial n=1 Tax=Aceria tosichella TaxID=561515 RepID=A0A6G1S9V0_9ACAR
MFAKHLTRLFVFKFLGIFASSHNKQHSGVLEEPPTRNSKSWPQNRNEAQTSNTDHQFEYAKYHGSKSIVNLMLVNGIPGVTVGVAIRGKTVWSSAFGFCDVENHLECNPDARMRVASISKPIFVATVLAPMIEANTLDISSSVHKYLSRDEFPKQKYEGKEYDITIEQLLTHTSGINHYGGGSQQLSPIGSTGSQQIYQCSQQYTRTGFYQRHTYRNVIDALVPFKDGPLDAKPGTKFNYTTYGWTLLSAVAEKVHQQTAPADAKGRKEQIEDYWMKVLRRDWGLNEISLDQDEPILSNRARYYIRSPPGGDLINAPYVDNSIKWAGGGLSSTVKDLTKFGTALIDSYKGRPGAKLKRDTVELLWKERMSNYCFGFYSRTLDPGESGGEKRAIYHTGGATGASSVLIIYPESEIVVAILANLSWVNPANVGFMIADAFAKELVS